MWSQIEDARAAMLLYERHKKEWERSVKDRLRRMAKPKKRKNKVQKMKETSEGDVASDS